MTALKRCDLTQDGVAEVVAGREDGTVTVSVTAVLARFRLGFCNVSVGRGVGG